MSMKNKKIVILFDGLGMGGIEKVGLNYIKILKQMNYEITIYNLNPKHNKMEKNIPKEIPIIRKKFTRFHVIGTYDQKFSKSLVWKIFRPFMKFLLYLYLSITKKDKQHYDIGISFSGHLNDLKFLNSKKIISDKKVSWLHGGLDDYVGLHKDYHINYIKIKNLIVLSDINQEKYDVSYYNIKKIYNPVDIIDKEINYDKVKQLKDEYDDFLLMIGRFSKQKDHKFIVDVLAELKNNHNIFKKLVFIGAGEKLDEVKSYVVKRKLENQVFLLGEKEDVQDYYFASHIYLHASPAEGLPTVLIEAMMLKTPIVSTNSLPGVPELIKNNLEGLICEINDINCMVNNILKLYTDKELYNNLVKNAFERGKTFSFENTKKELSLYLGSLK